MESSGFQIIGSQKNYAVKYRIMFIKNWKNVEEFQSSVRGVQS